jgi:hypothetical protein
MRPPSPVSCMCARELPKRVDSDSSKLFDPEYPPLMSRHNNSLNVSSSAYSHMKQPDGQRHIHNRHFHVNRDRTYHLYLLREIMARDWDRRRRPEEPVKAVVCSR